MKETDVDDQKNDIFAFIRSLAQRAGEERYSVDEITEWIDTLPLSAYAIRHLDDPQDGIAATIKRNKKGEINATKN